jgi:nitrogen fixation protein NifU and related proteins
MNELNDLYQEVILDHYKHPRNFGALEGANRVAQGNNPLCGDRMAMFVRMNGDLIEDVRFQGGGCAISTASASLMTDALRGRTKSDVADLFRRFHTLVTTGAAEGELGKLAVFSGVSEFPVRVKCATLAWHTLNAALEGSNEIVTTE